MYELAIFIHMKTTLNIDDHLLTEARRLTGIAEKTELVRAGLESLIERESARRLARLGGVQPNPPPAPRRRPPGRPPPWPLAPPSVWIDHLRRGNDQLALLLEAGTLPATRSSSGRLPAGHSEIRAACSTCWPVSRRRR